MVDYIIEHRRHIINKENITKTDIQIGNVITFRYDKSETNKNPIILVLNDNFYGVLHGLVVNYMKPIEFNRLKKYILSEVKEIDQDNKLGFEPSIRKLSIDNPNAFYTSRLKYFLSKNISQNIYRTYKIVDMTNIKIITYKF